MGKQVKRRAKNNGGSRNHYKSYYGSSRNRCESERRNRTSPWKERGATIIYDTEQEVEDDNAEYERLRRNLM